MWASLHSIVYGNSEAKWFATLVFGWLGSLMVILSGIFVWWFVWHFFNNFLIKLGQVIQVKEEQLSD